MSVLFACRLSFFTAASIVVMAGVGASSAQAQARPDLDALVYGGAAKPVPAQPSVLMQQPQAQQPAQRGLFNSIGAGPSGSASGGGALSAIGGMFSRPSRAMPQPMDAQAAMAQPTQTQPTQTQPAQVQSSQPATAQPQATPAPIYTPPAETAAEPAARPSGQRGLFSGPRSAGSGNGALAAMGRGFRSSPRGGGDYVPARVRYAPQPLPLAPPTFDLTYRVDAGDRLRIVVYGQDGLTNTYQIGASGAITMPLIGSVPARGRTPAELAGAITGRLRDGFIREPSVAVEIEAYRPFFILGEVAAPGQYPYVPHMSVESAIAIAGGFSPRAKRDAVTLTHSMPEGLLRAIVPPNTPLSPGDTIMVGERWF